MFCQRCGNALAPGARFCNACGTPVTAPAAPISTARPTAMQRSRQMRTIAGMNRIARSVETYRESHNAPPASIPPAKDAWTNNLRYVTDGTNYWIASAGKDGRFEEDDVSHHTKGATTNFDADIVLENGEMLRWPKREGR